MWPTSEGDRTLRGSEAVVLATAVDTMLGSLVDHLVSDEESPRDADSCAAILHTGIGLFDSLAIPQRIAALHHVTHHLLTARRFPTPSSSAIEDATIAAIYSEVRDQIEIEIDLCALMPSEPSAAPPDTPTPWMSWRRDVRNACCELLEDGLWAELQSDGELAALQLGEWELWVDLLASAILWDRDFEFAETFLDAEPDMARRRRQVLGISDDYFVRPAPDPDDRHLNRLIDETRQLVRQIQRQARCTPPPPASDLDF